jgi:UDP-2,4-diacetamido-2,4,6-trideoxy-beta-L-altropyranose hydrolase
MNIKLLILSEAGTGIGWGHYMRCSALSDYFSEKGIDVNLLLDVRGGFNIDKVETLDWRNNKEHVKKLSAHFSFILIDSYLADEDYYHFLTSCFKKVIVLDDYNRLSYPGNLIINPNIYGSELNYSNQLSKVTGGPDFVILRKNFRETNKRYAVPDKIRKVLITLGGSDIRHLLPKLINWFSVLNLELTVVAGSNEYKNSLSVTHGMKCKNVIGFANAEEMIHLMLSCDLAISACGQTLHELAYLGVPTIGICIGDDQINNMKKYIQLGVLLREIYWSDPALKSNLIDLFELVNSKEKLIQLSGKASSVLDGKGVEYIYKSIFSD